MDGFREAKRRRIQEEEEEGFALGHNKRGSGAGGVFARTMSMGRNLTGLGGGGARRGHGYEPVNAGGADV